jgi:hypothetical protein
MGVCKERLKLKRHLDGPETESPVLQLHVHFQMRPLGMELQEASRLGKQPVLEPSLGLLLQLQQHHRPLRRLKAIQRIAKSDGGQARRWRAGAEGLK